jgi:predicted nucleic acid-binding protein
VTVLVDSDIIIEILRGRDREIAARWDALSLSDGNIMYSAVSIAELWTGARPLEHEAIARFFRSLTCVPVDAEIARHAGDNLRLYKKSHGVGLGDALIAASAHLNKATLWTRNRKHYPMKELSFF